MKSLIEQIRTKRIERDKFKPRSHRHDQAQRELVNLIARQLRKECREEGMRS